MAKIEKKTKRYPSDLTDEEWARIEPKRTLSRFDSATNGNVVQCGEIGNLGADTTFTVALGFGGDAASAVAAANASRFERAPSARVRWRMCLLIMATSNSR